MPNHLASLLRSRAISQAAVSVIPALCLVATALGSPRSFGAAPPAAGAKSVAAQAAAASQTDDARTSSSNAREEAITRSYNEQFNSCVAALKAGKHDISTSLVCRHAADAAAEFAADQRFVEKRTADVYAATALANSGDMVAGLRYADRAIDILKLGRDDYAGGEAAYSTRAMIEAGLRNWEAADPDLALAEEFARKGLARAEQEKFAAAVSGYRQALSRDLRTHAVVLTQLKRASEAQAKLTEAARY